ncbi:site-specific integrase [Rhodocyclus tenuis]|uniref:Site-specific integrase n=1 Tax=Rhodocyclus gracilis TaxID=2929842 RepID=A0ABX0WJQ8_9RHOO|nr:site-specific integrase [Rhodocyclus gracilis]NJA89814.1 site-specific integrase [Rhodocyclus gracilis]
MASIRSRRETGTLLLDFSFRGERCREQTALPDTHPNRKRLQKLLDAIEAEIQAGTFNYRKYFPDSRLAARFEGAEVPKYKLSNVSAAVAQTVANPVQATATTPLFGVFADEWFAENEVRWRNSYRETLADIIRIHLKPAFGEKEVGQITKAEILKFRSQLAKVETRKSQKELSPSRINYVMMTLRQILTEAADRFNFTNSYRNIKPVKLKRIDVQPFSLDEVGKILATVRADFRNYYTVRFFSGMRTGEIDGLKWQYIDFERRLILVRETVVRGEEEYTKTDASQRDIQMSEAVYQALVAQAAVTRDKTPYVFANAEGKPLQHNNVTKRVWYPLLRYLGLKLRRPYQTRHTAATLWLASGENPQWISRQLGHSSTEMLFRVYSRFVPNLTRQDGSAFERLLLQSGSMPATITPPAVPCDTQKPDIAANDQGAAVQRKEVGHG